MNIEEHNSKSAGTSDVPFRIALKFQFKKLTSNFFTQKPGGRVWMLQREPKGCKLQANPPYSLFFIGKIVPKNSGEKKRKFD